METQDTAPAAESAAPVVVKKSQTDRIREKLLGAPREHRFEVVDDDGDTESILMMAPKIRRAGQIINECLKLPAGKEADEIKASEVEIDMEKLKVLSMIECLRDVDTKQPMFTIENRDELLAGHLSYLYNQLGEKAAMLVHPNHKKTKKNSAGSPTA